MLINRIAETGSTRVGDDGMQILEDNTNEFQAAEEIYQIMAKNSVFEGDGDKALTSDLVILYKNIDIGTKLVPNRDVKQNASNNSNQYVETIIYNDERGSEASDISEDISNEDLNHVFAINKERIDLIQNFGDTLCHKLGDIEMRTSGLTTEYDRHFLFNDPYIKEQLKSFHAITKSKQSESTVLPASLLDYICCKRHGDNYNFYMDNIIKYVQNTIEQLKRISNGDYLTDKAKAKWREVEDGSSSKPECKNTVGIPLHVANNNQKSTWDEIVHSEMDVRSLSKMLEKKVIVEVPKIICGTYRLFSKRCKDNLIITCKQDKQPESRVDVVLKLQRYKSGDVISNIDSIMLLKTLPNLVAESDTCSHDLLALEFEKVNDNDLDLKVEQDNKIIELDEFNEDIPTTDWTTDYSIVEETEPEKFSEDDLDFSPECDCHVDNECDFIQGDSNFNTIATDDNFHGIIQRLSMQSPVIEESEENMKKKKSSLRVRIKSPYENTAYVMEERKRKKLLEIRGKRGAKKNGTSDNCKITKKRHEGSAITAQASNSVTKLSITNKHFYNSIYGDNININNKILRKYNKDPTKYSFPIIKLENSKVKHFKDYPPPPASPEKNTEKYINRSYYLDDADTEVMYQESKLSKSHDLSTDDFAKSTTIDEIDVDLNFQKQLMVSSTTDLSWTDISSGLPMHTSCDNDSFINNNQENMGKDVLMSTQSTQVAVPTKSPKTEVSTEYANCATTPSVECRRSIDKIYDLIKQISETEGLAVVCSKTKITNNVDALDASDSGTSIKHQSTSYDLRPKTTNDSKKKNEKNSQLSKVTNSISKSQNNKNNNNTNNKENKKITFSKIQDNPLKAISQLIHEFDNAQKLATKNGNELKRHKKVESLTTEDKSNSRQNFLKRVPKHDQHLRNLEAVSPKLSRRTTTGYSGPFKVTYHSVQPAENTLDKANRKKYADIIDEEKELRGEAVRGPTKKLTRLNSLSQPKKPYPPTQQEESQNKYGRRVTDKLYKPMPPLSSPDPRNTSLRNKQKKPSEGLPATIKPTHNIGAPLERLSRTKPLTHNSPSRDGNGKYSPMSIGRHRYKQGNFNKTPELLNGKIETYIKGPYKRESQEMEPGDSLNAHKLRVPFVPNDFELASLTSSPSGLEESTVLGKKLHNIIDAMVNSKMPVLDALTECEKSASKLDEGLDESSIEGTSKSDEVILSLSDYPVDIFEDKNIVTAVSSIPKDHRDDEGIVDNNSNIPVHETTRPCPPNGLPNPENVFYNQISKGTFQKQLQIKNLKLNVTPKQSLEKIFFLKPGNTSSILLHSKLLPNKEPTTDSVTELQILPELSNNRINFGFYKFPMQIATVGYALPHFVNYDSINKISLLKNGENILNATRSENITNINLEESIQYFKDAYKNPSQETIQQTKTAACPLTNANKNKETLENCEVSSTENQNNFRGTVETDTIKDLKTNIADIKNSSISNSTSLDILVGLLNEIKKLTSYDAHHLPKPANVRNTDVENSDFEIILNNVAVKESSVDHNVNDAMSLSSFDNLKMLKERASDLLYLSPNIEAYNRGKAIIDSKVTTTTSWTYRPQLQMDKEVYVKTLPAECMHRFTEAPSRFALLSASTYVTDSFVKLMNKSPSQSIYSFKDCDSFNNSIPKVIKEVPSKILKKSIDGITYPKLDIQPLNHKEIIGADLKKLTMKRNNDSAVEFDSLMKMKRDILVTVYSILVLTVFAALSFPEIMYRVY